jgi:soluble lytic murein transglycosylase-like protein
MLRLGQTFARVQAATALIASAALLTGASAIASPRLGEEVAMAVPRIGPTGGAGSVDLPQPLDPEQAARLRRVLDLQAQGEIAAAAVDMAGLETTSDLGQAMLGVVLADRLLRDTAHTPAAQMQDWLDRWPDLPQAVAMQAALALRLPHDALPTPAAAPPPVALRRNAELDHSVAAAARTGRAATVQRLLAHTKGLSPLYASQLAGEAARILFAANHDQAALSLVQSWTETCGHGCAATARVVGGLAAWRLGRFDTSQALFAEGWRARLTSPSLRAAAAFWTARAAVVTGHVEDDMLWLRRAAAERGTFYGQLARRRLELAASLGHPVLGVADVDAVGALPGGARAFALLQIGRKALAAAELRQLWPTVVQTPGLARAVMLVTDAAGLPDLAAEMEAALQSPDRRLQAETRLALPPLSPSIGFSVDPAMVYGLARAESGFDPDSTSRAGAVGVLQIMPDTASFLTGVAGGRLHAMLHDPGRNLDLGQRYIAYLSMDAAVQGDLLRLLASYNCGPSRMADWSGPLRDLGDPLMFLEAIPVDETRAYVPRVLAYMWMYARRLHLPSPSLDELATGAWPRYHAPSRVERSAWLH